MCRKARPHPSFVAVLVLVVFFFLKEKKDLDRSRFSNLLTDFFIQLDDCPMVIITFRIKLIKLGSKSIQLHFLRFYLLCQKTISIGQTIDLKENNRILSNITLIMVSTCCRRTSLDLDIFYIDLE